MTPLTTERDAPAPAPTPAPANPIAAAPPKSGERFHQLDGLRAVASLIVVIHHSFTPIATAMQNSRSALLQYLGHLQQSLTGSGVELFFVLSGVVLLRPYVRGMRPFKTGTYFLRRIERIWPPYLVVLALEALLTIVASRFQTPLFRRDRGFDFSFGDFGLQAIILNFGWLNWNMSWWSLSIEVMFYVLVPLVLPLFIWKGMTRPVIGLVAVGLWVLGLAVAPETTIVTWHTGIQFLAVYSLCFLIGIAIAKFDWKPRAGWMFVGFGLLYLLTAVRWPAMNYHAAYAMLYGGLVMLAFVPGSVLQRVLSRHLMLWIGERSYSLFLIHFTIFSAVNFVVSHFVPQKDMTYFVLSRAFGLPLALFSAMLLFHFVERRFARNLLTANEFWPPIGLGLRVPRKPAASASSI